MIILNRRHFLLGGATCVALGVSGCEPARDMLPVSLTIDWVPSAEYYGFFVARSENIFSERGFDVTITNGTGAPAVASQLASNAISIGTTTSDNMVRILAQGARIERATPILPFNPATLITRPGAAQSLASLAGKTVGVNVQSAAYSQFVKALEIARVSQSDIREYPVGYGGVDEFASGRIDALVGYTSNHAVDLALRGVRFEEARFDNLGVSSAGLVLVATSQAATALPQGRLVEFFAACLEGYTRGGNNPASAVTALRATDPTLSPEKLQAAVRKVATLARQSTVTRWDEWLRGEAGVSEAALNRSNMLLAANRQRW